MIALGRELAHRLKVGTLDELKKQSPHGIYLEHCRKGELAYQVCTDDNTPVFYPRFVAPKTGSSHLEWRVSKGMGTVYSTTVIFGVTSSCGWRNANQACTVRIF